MNDVTTVSALPPTPASLAQSLAQSPSLAPPLSPQWLEAATTAKAWPFEEARKVVARLQRQKDRECGKPVLFQTGYGPSGLPHIGTFGEVARTTMVMTAFRLLTEDKVPVRLLCFSDDMDGMRKVPDNVPNPDLLRSYLGKPLTKVPNPFNNIEPSFGDHNNAKLRSFLDHFGFHYEFASATDYYARGLLDEMLMRMLARYDDVMAIMLPTLREERRKTYAPFLPLHPETGIVMQVPIDARDPATGLITWRDPDTGVRYETPVTGGGCKAQWKPDWALRWAALRVDYEMSGKDHIDNVKTSSKICKVLGVEPPDGFNYELFLDDQGQKISKSKGNGITIDEWLTYANAESLALFMFQKPKTAKRLYFDVIPRAVDDYLTFMARYPSQPIGQQIENPAWHIHNGHPPQVDLPISFSLLLNLVTASGTQDEDIVWGFVAKYAGKVAPETEASLRELVRYAVNYARDFVTRDYRAPDETERAALAVLNDKLTSLPANASGEDIQNASLEVARGFERYQDPKKKSPDGRPAVSVSWFQMLYQILLGQQRGPRFGSFVALYGLDESRALIAKAITGELASGSQMDNTKSH